MHGATESVNEKGASTVNGELRPQLGRSRRHGFGTSGLGFGEDTKRQLSREMLKQHGKHPWMLGLS